MTFVWDFASDGETHQMGLTYNIRVGSTLADSSRSGQDIIPAMSDTSGKRWIANRGNVGGNISWSLPDMLDGDYYGSVQSIDGGLLGSSFAAEQSFTVAVPPVMPNTQTPDKPFGYAQDRLLVSCYFGPAEC